MSLKIAIALLASTALGADAGSDADTFNSYTVAYHTAADVKQPLLVVLNPPAEEVSTEKSISVDDLRQDTEINELLENYVVAEIDTGTEHGQKVHELFGNKPLPRVVVIDSDQKLQIFRTSDRLDDSEMKDVLEKYQDGKRISTSLDWTRRYNIPGDCPNCRKF